MKKYAELEINLRPSDESLYFVDFQFVDPDSETDVRLDQGRAVLARLDPDALKELEYDPAAYGRALTDGLFADPHLISAFDSARVRVSAADDKKLRFRLSIGPTAPELHGLRWETLQDPTDHSPLCTNENILFSRYLSSYDWKVVKLRPKGSLSALVVIANPSDLVNYQMAPIPVEQELARARQALGEISVTALPEGGSRATLENILSRLREQEYDILYIVAHGSLVKDRPRLWLEDNDGKISNTSGQELVLRIKELEQRPRLIVLASCESAANTEGDSFAALGPRLAEAGIPGVLAMQGRISMETANSFMGVFFKELQRDGQIDRAMSVARGTVRERPDFWMPVLFMRLKNGRIWYVPGFSEGKVFNKWPALVEYIKNNECTPILGPGLFEAAFGSLNDLARAWSEEFRFPLSPFESDSLPKVAQYLAINQSPQFPLQRYQDFLRKDLQKRYAVDLPEALLLPSADVDQIIETLGARRRERNPNDSYKLLAQLPARIYITTNLNSLLVTALQEAGRDPVVILAPWNRYTENRMQQFSESYKNYDPSEKQPLVYYLFGRLSEPRSVVLTEDNYFDYLLGISRNNDRIPGFVRTALRQTSLLFIGFRMDEWNFRVLFRSIIDKKADLGDDEEIIHIAAQVEPEEGRIIDPEGARGYLEKYFEKSASINLYWGSSEEFIKELWQKWNSYR